MDQRGLDEAVNSVRQFVQAKIAAGFRPVEEIAEEAIEIGALDASASDILPLVPAIVDECLALHRAEQETWPEVTDCDRLSTAFEDLERRGILARQDFSCCGNCGVGEMWTEIDTIQAAGRHVHGYTLFHTQDTDAAVGGEGLYLNYGSVNDGTDAALAVGHQVVAALQAEGLRCRWDGTIQKRLFVHLDWKRRR